MEDKLIDELMDFLAKDEEEAIKGYDEVIAKLEGNEIVIQLEKIRKEEENHLKFLREVKTDHSLEYVDEHDDRDPEAKEASRLYGMKLGGK